MIALTQMFARPDPAATPREVIGWWERRRLYYNLIIIAWAAILICVLIAAGKERISWSAIASILVVYLLLFQLPANIFYTGGWIVDLIVKRFFKWPSPWFEPWALGMGIALSLLFYLVLFVAAIRSSKE